METIRDQLNKIKWDPTEDEADFWIGYEDRVAKKIVEIPYTDIIRLDEGVIVLEDKNMVPLHRVRLIKKKGEIIWQR